MAEKTQLPWPPQAVQWSSGKSKDKNKFEFFDLLTSLNNKRCFVELTNNCTAHGILEEIDCHWNATLKDATVISSKGTFEKFNQYTVSGRYVRYVYPYRDDVSAPKPAVKRKKSYNFRLSRKSRLDYNMEKRLERMKALMKKNELDSK
ncbi:LSM domain containing protein [Trichuris trichiura]|uniref:LSM domain containing protein n=1 Tax=Trichuris trichiura TaxID=36087 RepID=A0A077ZAE2_TRITR|nr:LSM domain containing protein [Trichuris trichiura]